MLLALLSAALAVPVPVPRAAEAPQPRPGLVLPQLPAPRLHPELARPSLGFAPAARTWATVELRQAPDLVSGLLGGAVAVSAQSWAQDSTLRRGSVLPGAWAGSVLEPPPYPEQAP